MQSTTDPRWNDRRYYVWAAWASTLVAVVVSVVVWLWITNHEGRRGERVPAVLLFYLVLLSASAVGGLAGVVSLFGIRSRRHAISIIPGALLGICINGYVVFICLLAYALEGRNLGG
jgi:hypothetical protein